MQELVIVVQGVKKLRKDAVAGLVTINTETPVQTGPEGLIYIADLLQQQHSVMSKRSSSR